MKKFFSILMVLVMVLSMTACGSSSKDTAYDDMYAGSMNAAPGFAPESAIGDGYYESDKGYSDVAVETPQSPNPGLEEDVPGEYLERKIVYTVTLDLQTKEFDMAMQLINDNVAANKAYVQSQKQTDSSGYYSKYTSRNLTMVVRVPSENLDTFLSGLKNENIHTISTSKDSKDYSTSYYDKQIRIDNLKIQEERLLDMLSKSADLKTLLELEDRLADIRYEIESLTKEMNIIDSNVNYSTVTIYMSEVVKYDEITEEPATFFERIHEAFAESWEDFVDDAQDFAVDFVYAIPTLIVWAIIIFIIVKIVKKIIRKKKGIDKTESAANIVVEKPTNVETAPVENVNDNRNDDKKKKL
jgi:hypothetical protein